MKTSVDVNTDLQLKADVLAELRWEPSVDESKICMLVDDGIVTFNTTVQHWVERAAAERVLILTTLEPCGGDKKRAARILGVSLKTLDNRLRL